MVFSIDLEKYRVVDLSYLVVPPGTPDRPFVIQRGRLGDLAYKFDIVRSHTHVGTHVETPAHFFPGGKDATALALDSFFGRAVLLDVHDSERAQEIDGAYLAYAHQLPRKPGKITHCTGCRPRNKQCAYLKGRCARLSRGEVGFCFECADFPCERLKHIDERYRHDYSYSMIETLHGIQSNGVEEVLRDQRERLRCPRCGGVICIHNGKCYTCEEVKSWRG